MNYSWHDVAGNVGVAFIVVTYLLLQIDKMDSHSIVYSAFNALGAVLIIVSLVFDFNLSSMIIEIFWLAISGVGVAKYFRAQANGRK